MDQDQPTRRRERRGLNRLGITFQETERAVLRVLPAIERWRLSALYRRSCGAASVGLRCGEPSPKLRLRQLPVLPSASVDIPADHSAQLSRTRPWWEPVSTALFGPVVSRTGTDVSPIQRSSGRPPPRVGCPLIIPMIIQTILRDPVWSRVDGRRIQREQARSVWSRPVRRRAPGYGSGGWGFESLAARHGNCSSAALSGGRCCCQMGRSATRLPPRWRPAPTRLRPPATTIASSHSS
jgi:hypothetical protein